MKHLLLTLFCLVAACAAFSGDDETLYRKEVCPLDDSLLDRYKREREFRACYNCPNQRIAICEEASGKRWACNGHATCQPL